MRDVEGPLDVLGAAVLSEEGEHLFLAAREAVSPRDAGTAGVEVVLRWRVSCAGLVLRGAARERDLRSAYKRLACARRWRPCSHRLRHPFRRGRANSPRGGEVVLGEQQHAQQHERHHHGVQRQGERGLRPASPGKQGLAGKRARGVGQGAEALHDPEEPRRVHAVAKADAAQDERHEEAEPRESGVGQKRACLPERPGVQREREQGAHHERRAELVEEARVEALEARSAGGEQHTRHHEAAELAHGTRAAGQVHEHEVRKGERRHDERRSPGEAPGAAHDLGFLLARRVLTRAASQERAAQDGQDEGGRRSEGCGQGGEHEVGKRRQREGPGVGRPGGAHGKAHDLLVPQQVNEGERGPLAQRPRERERGTGDFRGGDVCSRKGEQRRRAGEHSAHNQQRGGVKVAAPAVANEGERDEHDAVDERPGAARSALRGHELVARPGHAQAPCHEEPQPHEMLNRACLAQSPDPLGDCPLARPRACCGHGNPCRVLQVGGLFPLAAPHRQGCGITA